MLLLACCEWASAAERPAGHAKRLGTHGGQSSGGPPTASDASRSSTAGPRRAAPDACTHTGQLAGSRPAALGSSAKMPSQIDDFGGRGLPVAENAAQMPAGRQAARFAGTLHGLVVMRQHCCKPQHLPPRLNLQSPQGTARPVPMWPHPTWPCLAPAMSDAMPFSVSLNSQGRPDQKGSSCRNGRSAPWLELKYAAAAGICSAAQHATQARLSTFGCLCWCER